MLNDTKRLANQLPRLARAIAQDVYDDLDQVTCSNETRSALALAAGLREVVESGDIPDMMFLAYPDEASTVQLLGFADARCRKLIGGWLYKNPERTAALANAIGIRSISHSRRINGIFRHAIAYAQTI